MPFDTLTAVMELDSSSIQSGLKSMMTSIHKTITDPQSGKLDMSKFFDSNLNSINWTSIIGKLFSPANLIAFFSAMATTGIIQMAQQQSLTATTQGTTGLTGVQAGNISAEAVQTFRSLGTSVGSLQDVQTAITQFTALTGSVSQAQQITQALGQAVETTGTTLSAVLPNLVTFLQNAGISSEPAIVTIIDNLMQSVQASGGLESMGTIAQQLSDFGTAAQAAKSPLSAISQQIVAFGGEIKDLGVEQATANQDLLNQALEGTQTGLLTSGKSKQAFDVIFNTQGPVTAMDLIASRVKTLTPNMNALVASSLGLPESAVVGAQAFLTVQGAIAAAAKTANTSMGPALADINKQWNTTDDLTRDMGKALALLETAFMNTDAVVKTINSDLKTSGMTTTEFGPNVNGNAIEDALIQLMQTSSTNPSLKASPTTVNQTITINGASAASTGQAVGSATSALNNMIHGQSSNAGTATKNSTTGGLTLYGFNFLQ
jgi:hypothetical protein